MQGVTHDPLGLRQVEGEPEQHGLAGGHRAEHDPEKTPAPGGGVGPVGGIHRGALAQQAAAVAAEAAVHPGIPGVGTRGQGTLAVGAEILPLRGPGGGHGRWERWLWRRIGGAQGMEGQRSRQQPPQQVRLPIRGGKFLIKSIQQRQQTILAIAREIAARQRAFLEEGVSALAPMTMAQVAEAVGVHETTVSRAIAGKTVATPQGVFEMKFFFTGGYRAADGASVSSTSVKDAIAALIRGEDPLKPLSDQQIVQKLSADGLAVARRTVAKYREALGILPSHLRKSF